MYRGAKVVIHFFTDPYKDELIYSAIARYHFYSGNTDYKDTLEECLGKRSAIPTLEIGDNLEYLVLNVKLFDGSFLTLFNAKDASSHHNI